MKIVILFVLIGILYVVIDYVLSLKPNSQARQSNTTSANDPYVQAALEFLKFYRCLSEQGGPRVILTEEYIGVMLRDDSLGSSIQLCLDSKARGDSEVFEVAKSTYLLPRIDALSLNGDGSKLFTSLSLDIHLHNHDADHPVILKWLFCKDILEREKYIQIIERQYKQIYHENIHIISGVTW